MLKFDEWT